ncbi:hypothetical protein PR001_g16582 [Phytophthora rubi]|uniref:PiggyBac transposable element-derived protein domain-containing protein n=1 Tax=Phytophthora rubi TaxID=129364 RepID=A0A6A3KNJ2_9STRA|nr:hypothetical protein PR001_g16582 [Phytophthora rubi]
MRPYQVIERTKVSTGEDVNAPVSVPLMCVIDGDPNLMSTGAAVCTGLNSDEDPDVREELEDEEDADEDSWDGDWDIGSLTDEESDAELEKLPESTKPSLGRIPLVEDPLALLFYFMPPKLWAQIAVESNSYLFRSAHGRFGRSSVKVVAKWRISGTFGGV